MINLLFTYQKNMDARWISNDMEILESSFKVTRYEAKSTKGPKLLFDLVRQFLFHLRSIGKYDLFYIWFADYHSLIPALFSKVFFVKSVIVIGGYDADEILINKPESLKARIRRYFVLGSIKLAHFLLPVSEVNKSHLIRFVCPGKCEVLYNCVNIARFPSDSVIPSKSNLVITVGGGGQFIKEAKRKRLDFFIEIGEEFNRLYPDYDAKFYLIGHDSDSQTFAYLCKLITHKNIELKPKTVNESELITYFHNASVYMQLSYYEAFGVAQAEAMLFGCIPVSNPGGAIPEVVGDSGFLIRDFNVKEYISTIREILDGKHEKLRIKARNRVTNVFSLEVRKDKLLKIIDSLIS